MMSLTATYEPSSLLLSKVEVRRLKLGEWQPKCATLDDGDKNGDGGGGDGGVGRAADIETEEDRCLFGDIQGQTLADPDVIPKEGS
jgi:hypothetical protein